MKDDLKYFKFLKSEGDSSEAAYIEAQKLRLDYFTCIRMLRSVYGLSLTEAKKITIIADKQAQIDESQLDFFDQQHQIEIIKQHQSEMMTMVKTVDKLLEIPPSPPLPKAGAANPPPTAPKPTGGTADSPSTASKPTGETANPPSTAPKPTGGTAIPPSMASKPTGGQ
jgi:hypothetical protein